MGIVFPGESPEYRAARDRLLEREIELRRAMEAVAAARRELPPGGVVPRDYVFHGRGADGAPVEVRLSELFAPSKASLLIYSFMFPRDPPDQTPGPSTGQTALLPLAEGPCPTCAAFIDQLEGAAEHVNQHINLVVVAKTPLHGCPHSPRSAGGGGFGSSHPRTTHTTPTTTPRPPRARSGRC